jgi:hypothetical protein
MFGRKKKKRGKKHLEAKMTKKKRKEKRHVIFFISL